MDRLFQEYRGRIRLVFYHVAFNSQSFKASEAALCAGLQGKFWEYHDKLFERQDDWSKAAEPVTRFERYALDLSLNAKEFSSCLRSGKMAERINRDKKLVTSRGVSSTPTIFIGDRKIVGSQPLPVYQRAINELIKNQ